MDIKEKQAIWLKEKPLFEAEFIHSHLLPFFHFNENTGDYEIKTESVNNTDEEDRKVAYESLNTGWVMWLRAKRTAKAQVPEGFVLVPKELSENIAHQLAKSEFKKSETIFNSSYRDLSIDAKNDLKQKWIEQKTRCIVVDYKTLIGKAQEQGQ